MRVRELRFVPLLDVIGGWIGDGAGDLVAEPLGQARVLDGVLDADASQITER